MWVTMRVRIIMSLISSAVCTEFVNKVGEMSKLIDIRMYTKLAYLNNVVDTLLKYSC